MSTGRAHPQPSLGGPRLGPVAGGAHELLPPAEPRQVLAARVLGREARVELPERARVVLHSLNHYRLGLLESRTYPNSALDPPSRVPDHASDFRWEEKKVGVCLRSIRGHPRLQLLEPIEECSESEQPVDLDDEGPVLKFWKTRCQRVALLVVDDEQLAARLILPAQSQVCPRESLLELYCSSAPKKANGVRV